MAKRPSKPAAAADVRGMCRQCGCTDFDPCGFGCAWTNRTQTVCTECEDIEKAEAHFLEQLTRAGTAPTGPQRVAFHIGWIVGWFKVRGKFGANPYVARSFAEEWNRGMHAAATMRADYVRLFGPVLSKPRRVVLIPMRQRERRFRTAAAR